MILAATLGDQSDEDVDVDAGFQRVHAAVGEADIGESRVEAIDVAVQVVAIDDALSGGRGGTGAGRRRISRGRVGSGDRQSIIGIRPDAAGAVRGIGISDAVDPLLIAAAGLGEEDGVARAVGDIENRRLAVLSQRRLCCLHRPMAR